jgi:signal transduction histidine kinase
MLLAERLAAVGRFAAGLAHEINSPLQAVRTNLELALDFEVGLGERERCLRIVRQEIERIAQITRGVLDFAQPADDTRYSWSIARLVERTLALVDGQLRRAHVRVTSDLPDDLPPVFVAPDQIVQVLLNLVVNAIEAMPDGGHMQVKARVDGDMLAVDISNDGPPIPPEYIERVFDVFFTTKPKGTGLGLPISYSIVRRHGGTIRVENQGDDGGVRFTVTLPVARIPSRQEGPA